LVNDDIVAVKLVEEPVAVAAIVVHPTSEVLDGGDGAGIP
jgi:hypothetical protein